MEDFLREQERKQRRWVSDLFELENLFTPQILRQIVNKIYADMVVYTEKEIEKCYLKYSELAKKNVPYTERVNLINMKRVSIFESNLARLKKERSNYKIRPLRDWLQDGDFQLMRKMGSQKFISLFLDLAIVK